MATYSNRTALPTRSALALALGAVLASACSGGSDAPQTQGSTTGSTDGAQSPALMAPVTTPTTNPVDAPVAQPSNDGLAPPMVPPLDPFAAPIPGPDASDPFGTLLEIDNEAPVAGGPPTTPKNLRAVLVSNNWAELDWAPANDDSYVAAYRLYRSDGHMYEIRGDNTSSNGGTQNELNKNWATTSFIDCNLTRFASRVYDCAQHSPEPGETYSYVVTAVDDAGQESPRSQPITVRYHDERGAPVPRYQDFYLSGDDTFAQDHDLSNTAYFLNKFENVFEDEFDLGYIDGSKWNTSLTWGDGVIINGEQQYFVDTQKDPGFGYSPFNVSDSQLKIQAVPMPDEFRASLPQACNEADPTGLDHCEFLSGALSSHDLFGMTYGYVESRMKVANAPGALSSFYLYNRYPGSDKTLHGPEIDIVEYLGENPFGDEDAFQTYHFEDTITGITRSAPTMNHANPTGELYSDDFHTFGVLWEPQLVIWYIDGVEVKRMSGPQVARQQMNIVTYLVTGSEWAPTPDKNADIFPMTLTIDWIRAWQRPAYVGNGVYPDR